MDNIPYIAKNVNIEVNKLSVFTWTKRKKCDIIYELRRIFCATFQIKGGNSFMLRKLTSILLCGVLLLSLMILPVGAERIVTRGEVGRIDVWLKSSTHTYTAEDFPGIDIEKIEQYNTTKALRIYIVEKTEEATDAAMEQIKVILDGKYLDIIQYYKVVAVVDNNPGMIVPDGDVNKDNKTNLADVSILMQYIAGWDVEIREVIADMNRDDSINLADVTILMKHIAGWDI